LKLRNLVGALALIALVLPATLRAADDDLRKELDRLKKDLDATKGELEAVKKKSSSSGAPIASAAAKVENKYGPNANVTTKQGKLSISGLLQVWYYSIQNDNIGFYGDVSDPSSGTTFAFGGGDANEGKDNDSFTIRRAELKFTMDIHENVTAVIMIDPARPTAGRPAFPTNVGIFSRTGVSGSTSADVISPSNGNGLRMFQDAYINYHGVVPRHDFTVGQYKPFLGEEGIRSSSALDFAERSMIGALGDKRDLGITAHGTWWDDRFQYWLGAFNNAGDWFGSAGGDQQNRVDDNDDKDFVWRVLVRPVWKHETWGSLEIGGSGQHGIHGEGSPREDGSTTTVNTPALDGLNRRRTNANRYYFWASYAPGGPVKGWWLKGEYAWIEDRVIPGGVASVVNGANGVLNNGFASAGGSAVYYRPNKVNVEGFYFATGYKISDSVWKDSAPGWLKNFEFAFRYEQFENILLADLVRPHSHTDTFATDVWTAGINYYIKGNNAKIQLNYIVVDNPDEGATVTRGYTGTTGATAPRRRFNEVDNNSFVVNFQVAW